MQASRRVTSVEPCWSFVSIWTISWTQEWLRVWIRAKRVAGPLRKWVVWTRWWPRSKVPAAVRSRTPLLTAFPQSQAARCFDRIAQRLISDSSDSQKFDAFFRRLAGHDPVGV